MLFCPKGYATSTASQLSNYVTFPPSGTLRDVFNRTYIMMSRLEVVIESANQEDRAEG